MKKGLKTINIVAALLIVSILVVPIIGNNVKDGLTNKYAAMLDDGTVSNIYTKEEIDNKIDEVSNNLQSQITSNTDEINSVKENITNLQTDLENYALRTDLEKTNSNLETISTNLSTDIANLEKNINNAKSKLVASSAVLLAEEDYNVGYVKDSTTYTITESGFYIITVFGTGYTYSNSGRFGPAIFINNGSAYMSQAPGYPANQYVSEQITWLGYLNEGDIVGIGCYDTIPYNSAYPNALALSYQIAKI